VNPDTPLRRVPAVLWRRSLDAVLFLPPGAPDALTLGGTGPEIWELLLEPRTLDALVTLLAAAHGADPAVVRADVEPVLDQLLEVGAVEILAG
jgi:Coenzyme PQQ synthesis protein D (PqqD)